MVAITCQYAVAGWDGELAPSPVLVVVRASSLLKTGSSSWAKLTGISQKNKQRHRRQYGIQ
jgi:hypothetical protein